jgi:hypothetical protein
MQLTVMREAGRDEALLGMALSYAPPGVDLAEWWTPERAAKAESRALKLAHRGGGHSKFLESIQVWLYIKATRGWWSQFDTYRAGVTKQSASTMHMLMKRPPARAHFHPDTPSAAVTTFIELWRTGGLTVSQLKAALPEGYLQERMVCTNYKTLQNVVAQRHDHRLGEWADFCEQLKEQLEHSEYVFKG